MKILFTLAVVSFAALVWAVLAIVRHVRTNSSRAATQPAADAELSEAIDLRLSRISRQQPNRGVPPSPETQQDFSYFNRDADSSLPATRPYADPASAGKSAAADHS